MKKVIIEIINNDTESKDFEFSLDTILSTLEDEGLQYNYEVID